MVKSIIIDPGHGGTDPGASGFGVREKDWTLRVSLYQYERLKELGAKVGITRTTDKTLDSVPRTNLIKGKYDVCISNHWNAFNGSARGIETIHSVFGGKEFATSIANHLVKATGLPLRRVFTRKLSTGQDYYFMHRLTGTTRTVIVEYGFIDNKTDHDWYKNDSNFIKAAESVIEAVCKEIGITYKAPSGSSKPVAPSKPTPSKPKPAPSKPADNLYGAKLVKNEKAKYTVTTANGVKVRNAPSTKATHTGTLKKGQSINYDQVYEGNGYRWLAYTGSSGKRLYLPYRPLNGKNEQWGYFGSGPSKSTPKPKPKPKAKTLHLPKTAKTWRVYRPNGPYTVGNEIHLLTPSAYGGISYEIKGNPAPNVYLIDTKVKGRVAIYAGKETGAVIK